MREISYSYFLSKHRLKKIVNLDDVDDLTNNVYLAFAEQYHSVENIENWLRRVLFLTFIRWHKRNRLTGTVELNENITADNEQHSASTMIDAEAILKLLDTLSEDKQKIVKLRFWGDLKFQEIAEKMDKTEAAVKKMFYRTLEELKNMIK